MTDRRPTVEEPSGWWIRRVRRGQAPQDCLVVNLPQTTTVLAFCGLLLFGAIIGGLFFVKLPTDNVSTFNLALGALLGWVGASFTYYFGDTKKGQQQTDTIQTLAKTADTAATTAAATADPPPADKSAK